MLKSIFSHSRINSLVHPFSICQRSSFYFADASAAQPGPIDKKVWKNALEVSYYFSTSQATFDLKDGVTILAGGFGLCGIPENLIKATAKREVKNLTLVSNECGSSDYGLSLLLQKHQVARVHASYIGQCKIFE